MQKLEALKPQNSRRLRRSTLEVTCLGNITQEDADEPFLSEKSKPDTRISLEKIYNLVAFNDRNLLIDLRQSCEAQHSIGIYVLIQLVANLQ